jgi:hypothetical protein
MRGGGDDVRRWAKQSREHGRAVIAVVVIVGGCDPGALVLIGKITRRPEVVVVIVVNRTTTGGMQFDPLRCRGRNVIGHRTGRDPVYDERKQLPEDIEQRDRERGSESGLVGELDGNGSSGAHDYHARQDGPRLTGVPADHC